MKIQKGLRLKDKVLLFLILQCFLPLREILKKHPNLFQKIFKIFNRDFCITIKTYKGPARVIVNITEQSEIIIFKEIVINENYEVKQSHSCLIDVGAFRGISTIFIADQIKTKNILAIEPQKENVKILRNRLKKYLPYAKVIEAALGKKTGYFNFSGHGVSGKLTKKGKRVLVITCKNLSLSPKLKNPLIKMDIEGGEVDVLPSLLKYLPQKCVLFIETHCGFSQGLKLLKRYLAEGFQITKMNNKNGPYIDWKIWRK